MSTPAGMIGLNHVALHIQEWGACEHFYLQILGLKEVWRPDPDNLYLSSGKDNLALHRAKAPFVTGQQHLDHIGFALARREDVDTWFTHLRNQQVKIVAAPKDHRDGTRSFYCEDPDGNVIQFIWLT